MSALTFIGTEFTCNRCDEKTVARAGALVRGEPLPADPPCMPEGWGSVKWGAMDDMSSFTHFHLCPTCFTSLERWWGAARPTAEKPRPYDSMDKY